MENRCWLVKQEPSDYAWADLVREGCTAWTGVRNFQARNNLKAMRSGDTVLFYHSGEQKAVIGIAQVAKEAYPDPTADEEDWVCVDLQPVKPLGRPVPLQLIRESPRLRELALVHQPRLSVLPVSKSELREVLRLGQTPA